ncbi:MAG: glutamate-cysteine ligase family protein [Candidatus Gastranaerophilaceae bacterium]|jgi:glutamate--cysteine ligase
MAKELLEKSLITSNFQLEEIFYSGIKNISRIGIEFEKLPLYNNDFKAVSYYGKNGISDFLKVYAKTENWQKVKFDENIIGLDTIDKNISLEPGSQFEISLFPQNNIHQIKEQIDKYNSKTAFLAEKMGFSWIGYGIQPVSTYHTIDIIPKKRYEFMSNYLTKVANLPLVMMRETAGVQAAFDYKSEEDAINKFRLALKLSPIVTAMFANSPIRQSEDTGYKSFRATSWLNTDKQRCGLVSEKLFDSNYEFTFKDYVEILLDIPMIFMEKEGKFIPAFNITFREYLKNGYEGYNASLNDWYLHMNLYFPDVRLASYLEIRNHDSQRSELIPSIPALWKGILYNQNSFDAVNNLLSKFNYQDFETMRNLAPKHGLDFEVNGYKIADIAKEILAFSKAGLIGANLNEEIYLEPIEELVNDRLTPADLIIKNWHGYWNKDIAKLIEYSKLL